MEPHLFTLPRLRDMARQGLPSIVEGTLLPVAIFYLGMWSIGMWGAVIASLAWSWGAVVWRIATGRRVPGLLMVGVAAITARTIISFLSGSIFVYFLQPTLGTVALAMAFLVSVPVGKPLASRLAADFMPMPDAFANHPSIERFFARVTILWGGIQLANAGIGLWLLMSQPVSVYLAAKTVATAVVMAAAIAGSTYWFRLVLRRTGVAAAAA